MIDALYLLGARQVPLQVTAVQLDLEAEDAVAHDPVIQRVGRAVLREGVRHLVAAQQVQPADQMEDGDLGQEVLAQELGGIDAAIGRAQIAGEVEGHMLRPVAAVAVDAVGMAESVMDGMVHGASADQRAEEGHLLAGRMPGADLPAEATQFGLGLHEEFERMGVLPVTGDRAGIGVEQVAHDAVLGFVRRLRHGPSPQVHQKHGAPPLRDGAGAVLNRDTRIADGQFLHHHGAELKRRAAAGRNLEGLDVDDLDIAVHGEGAI